MPALLCNVSLPSAPIVIFLPLISIAVDFTCGIAVVPLVIFVILVFAVSALDFASFAVLFKSDKVVFSIFSPPISPLFATTLPVIATLPFSSMVKLLLATVNLPPDFIVILPPD